MSPSSPLRRGDEHRLDEAVQLLESWGLTVDVAVPPRAHRYLAGTTAERAEILATVLTDAGTRAVFCTRGGVGAAGLLDVLAASLTQSVAPNAAPADRERLSGHAETSTDGVDRFLVGFSDVTALHLALRKWQSGPPDDPLTHAASRVSSIHGPNAATGQLLDDTRPSEANRLALERCLFDPDPKTVTGRLLVAGTGTESSTCGGAEFVGGADAEFVAGAGVDLFGGAGADSVTGGGAKFVGGTGAELAGGTRSASGTGSGTRFVAGAGAVGAVGGAETQSGASFPTQDLVAAGPIVGGCLSLLTSLCGTPFLPPTSGALVFLEEVGEAPYAIERSLVQLIQAGVFDGAAGIIVGTFEDCDDGRTDIDAVLIELFTPLGLPVVTGVPFGHGEHNIAFRLGPHAVLTRAADTAQSVTLRFR